MGSHVESEKTDRSFYFVARLIFFLASCGTVNSKPENVCATEQSCQQLHNTSSIVSGPSWDLSEEYASINDPQIFADIRTAENEIETIENLNRVNLSQYSNISRSLSSDQMRTQGVFSAIEQVHRFSISSAILLLNVRTYATCTLATNTSNVESMKLFERLNYLALSHAESYTITSDLLNRMSEHSLQAIMKYSPIVKSSEFLIRNARKSQHYTLSSSEESILDSYAIPGILSWGALYTELSGKISVELGDEYGGTVGLAIAEGKLNDPDVRIRKSAWQGINAAWSPHLLTCAAALNAMTSWRAETVRRRKYADFLEPNLQAHRMERSTLEAMMAAVRKNGSSLGRKTLKIQASALGKGIMEPWDLSAPAPTHSARFNETRRTFDEAIDLVANAAESADEEMGEFIRMMRDKKYIEASSKKSKRPGSFYTIFYKSRTPRVYLNDFNGMNSEVLNLAHELGHAWHSWVMRDMPPQTVDLPPNLSETASLFLESLTAAEIAKRAETPQEKFNIQWTRAQNTHKFLCNVPARFDFEYTMNERRANSRLSVEELDEIMVESWRRYYKDSLGSLESVGTFFASKLHFYIPTMPFYNHSYIFGYIFSFALLRMREEQSSMSFSARYRNLLRDSGSLSVEDLARKHLGSEIGNEAWWNEAIKIVQSEVDEFENTASRLGYL